MAAAIAKAIGHAKSLVDIGSGTGSYGSTSLAGIVIAVEPSLTMIRQRPADAPFVVQAVSEALPFMDKAFDVAMAIFTVHHWNNPALGLSEMCRVASRQVILTWDADVHRRYWLLAEYLPELEQPVPNWVTVDAIRALLPNARVVPVPVPWDCLDGFGAAYWRRPERYLDPQARQVISGFALCPSQLVAQAMERLAADIQSGEWAQRHHDLEQLEELDVGYRLVIAGSN